MNGPVPTRFDRMSELIKRILGAVSVRTKILGIVLALTLALGLGVTWQVRTTTNGVLLDELDLRGMEVADDLAARSVEPMLLDDRFSVHQLLTQTVANHPDIAYAFVTDSAGLVVAHTFGPDGFPIQLLGVERAGDPVVVYDSGLGRIHDFASPVFASRIGTVRVGLSERRLRSLVDEITAQMLLTTMVVAVAGIAAAVFLTWILTRPILDLVATTRRVGAGDLSARARPWANDEVGVLAEAFNQMVEDLDDSRATIEAKEEARTRLLDQLITAQEVLTTMVVAVAGIAAAVFLTWILTRPILDLVATTRRVGAGDLSARARPWANDEVGVLAEAFNQMVEDLDDSRATIEAKEEARTRLLDQLITAQEEERKRIARQLHDGVGQSLNTLILGLSTLIKRDNTASTVAHATQLRDVTLETLDAVRRLGRELRPSVLDDLGLAEALAHYAAEVAGLYPQVRVDTHLDLDRRLPPAVEIAIYRMVQEGMTNAARHSGARTINVVVAQRDGVTQAIIEDDGRGFDVEAVRKSGASVGIHGMQERADLVGGKVRFESSAGGTTVFIEVPG
ncbi:MAG: hypothetical protein A2Z12_04020 [Actinobacteria bacterium RBG_16_68_21]|nr:MAG: hypothetical protein A2Z12_04020 [Actinobacteria bacterium RBG_16_68_21]